MPKVAIQPSAIKPKLLKETYRKKTREERIRSRIGMFAFLVVALSVGRLAVNGYNSGEHEAGGFSTVQATQTTSSDSAPNAGRLDHEAAENAFVIPEDELESDGYGEPMADFDPDRRDGGWSNRARSEARPR